MADSANSQVKLSVVSTMFMREAEWRREQMLAMAIRIDELEAELAIYKKLGKPRNGDPA